MSKTNPKMLPDSYYAASISQPFCGDNADGDMQTNVCIIGGGYTGTSAALHLARQGISVILLEAQTIGWGASGRNGGQVCTGQRKEQGELEQMLGKPGARGLWDLSEEAKHTLRSLIQEFSIECDYKPGIAHADHKSAYADETRHYVEKLNREYDYDQVRYLSQSEMAEVTGSETYYGGSFDLGAGHLHPLNYVLGLARAARNLGAKIFEQAPVSSYQTGEHVMINTPGFKVKADHVVLACNGYLGKLEPRLAGKIMPINNFVAATQPLSDELADRINPQDIAIADSRFVVNYYRMSADRRLLFGGGENYRSSFPKDIAAFVRKPMSQIYPQLKDIPIDYAWGGTLAVTLNRLPHFGTLDQGQVIYAQGYSGQGVALATLAGKLIAEVISGEADRFDAIAKLPTPSFPGGTLLRWPGMVLGMAYYALRDRL